MHKKLPALFFIIFLVGLCVAIALRIVLVRSYIDPSTGFYKGAYSTPATALDFVAVIFTLALIFPFFLPQKALAAGALPEKPFGLGVLSLLGAFGLFWAALRLFAGLLTTDPSGGTFLDALCTLAAAVYFCVQAKAFITGKRGRLAIPALLPVLWATIHLIVSWMHYTTVTNVSAYLFDMLKMIAFMLFFYYYARYIGGVSNKREVRGMLAFGLPSVLFGLLTTVPPVWVRMTGGKTMTLSFPDMAATFILSIYILILLVRVFLIQPKSLSIK